MTIPNPDVLAFADRKIDVFAAAMKQEMRANNFKGNWFNSKPESLLHDAQYHLAKMHVALRRPGILGDPCTCEGAAGKADYRDPKPIEHDDEKCAGNDPILEFACDVANLLMMACERQGLLGLTDLFPDTYVHPDDRPFE